MDAIRLGSKPSRVPLRPTNDARPIAVQPCWTLPELAAYLQVSRRTITAWIRQGRSPSATPTRVEPTGGRPDKPGVLKPGLKEGRRLVREKPEVRGRWALFPRVVHPGRAGRPSRCPSRTTSSSSRAASFSTSLSRTRGSRDEQLDAQQKRQGSLWSQRNLYRDVVEPAREAAGVSFTLYDARDTFVSTLMAAGVLLPVVAAYSGHSVGELAAVAASDGRLRSQTTLAVYTHATGASA
jgi:hypothetical protein